MKHIKKFEKLLKYSDDKVINNIFRNFTEKLKEILILLKNANDIPKSYIKIYYDSSGEINIKYGYKYNDLFTIRLLPYDRSTGLELTLIFNYFNEDKSDYSKSLYNIFDTVLEKYEEERSIYYRYCRDIKIDNINDLSVLDKIYNEVKYQFEIFIQTKKYNL